MKSSLSFVGIESSNSHAKGLLTLFLVGRLAKAQIEELIDGAQENAEVCSLRLSLRHLHFGAEGTFDGEQCDAWVEVIKYFLREGFWCTLEMRTSQAPLIVKTGLCKQARFIPLVRVPLPLATELGGAAVLQLEDRARAWSVSCTGLLQTRVAENAPHGQRVPIEGKSYK